MKCGTCGKDFTGMTNAEVWRHVWTEHPKVWDRVLLATIETALKAREG